MTYRGNNRAPERVGAGWLALSAGCGLAVAAATWLALALLLPEPLARSLIPSAAGAADGALAGLALAALRERSLRRPLLSVLVAVLVAAVAIGVMSALFPEVLKRKWFGYWSPALGGISAALWAVTQLWEHRARRRLAAFTAIIAGLALAALLLNNGRLVYRALAGDYVRSWNVYHYYVGSKYFAELGYRDLYAATLVADDEWRRRKWSATPEEWGRMSAVADFSHIEQTRDMQTYRRISRQRATAGFERTRFSDERWEQFGRDTRALREYLSDESWKGVLTDLGYNPSPAWTVLGSTVANLVPIEGAGSWLVANSDLPLLIALFGFVWWAFGARAAFMVLLWLNVIHFNRARLAGGFFQYDWLASVVIGYALYCKGWARAAGVVFSWGVMTRIFPAFLALPIAAKLVVELVRGRVEDRAGARRGFLDRFDRRRLRFAVALVLSCAVIFGLSHFTGRGLSTWPEWVDKIAHHSHLHPVMDPQRIGIGRLVLHQPTDDDPWAAARGEREVQLAASRPLKRAIQALGLLLLAAALIRRRDEDAMVLMLFGVFLILTLSRYYASAWVLLLLLEHRPDDGGPLRPAPFLAGAFLLLMAAVFFVPETKSGCYFLVNYEALAMFAAICVALALQALRPKGRAPPAAI